MKEFHLNAKGNWPLPPAFWLSLSQPLRCWQWTKNELDLLTTVLLYAQSNKWCFAFGAVDSNPADMVEFSGTRLSASLSQHSLYSLLSFSVTSQQYISHTWLLVTSEEFISPNLAPPSFIASVRTACLPPRLPQADRCLLSCLILQINLVN